jgi:hypothetical protein
MGLFNSDSGKMRCPRCSKYVHFTSDNKPEKHKRTYIVKKLRRGRVYSIQKKKKCT